MRILITNDDGVHAAGLLPLIRWASKLGEVTTIVPKVEQSGKSHGIEIHKAFEAKLVSLAPDVTVWAVDSTPADCVRFGILGMNMEFDLVISGVNRGLNIGADIMYSGTVAAIFEAANLGVKAMALSTSPEYYAHAVEDLDRVYDYITERKLFELNDLYNINIPANASEIRITRQGGPYYSDDFVPQENDMYLPHGMSVWVNRNNPELDTDTVLAGHCISISPLTVERTNLKVFEMLK